jgi:hypothetical protein
VEKPMNKEIKDQTTKQHIAEFLTESQLANRWQLSIRTLQQSRWKSVGCPYVKIGRLVRYKHSDVVAYESNQVVEVGQQHGQH